MSYHSHSSSEVIALKLKDVLPVFLNEFLKDFAFEDVEDEVHELFTKSELKLITRERNQEQQVLCLFRLLSTEDRVEQFLNIIRKTYKWLVEWVFQERDKPSERTEIYLEKLKYLLSTRQGFAKYNILRADLYMELRKALRELQPRANVVLLGELGTGKKWLALDVCTEYSLMKRMDFKIFWIDVTNCNSPEEDLRALQEFDLKLNDSTESKNFNSLDRISNRILALRNQIKSKLEQDKYKNCLLVLKNVQNVHVWKRFNLGCKILIITRNNKVSELLPTDLSTVIRTDVGLTQEEFFLLFEKILMQKREIFPPYAIDIYNHSDKRPYLLSLIAKNLRNSSDDHWRIWIKNLQDVNIKDNKLTRVVEKSLNVLTDDELNLYTTFSIFEHSISIPDQIIPLYICPKLLGTLWNKTELETKNILDKFHKFLFVKKDGHGKYRIPLVYSSYLKSNRSMNNRDELHEKVLQYYRINDIIIYGKDINWSDNQYDLYFFNCIGHHLLQANHKNLLSRIYFDFGFLEQKIRKIGLLQTLGNIKFYKETLQKEHQDNRLLSDIIEFLPKIEDKLLHSQDTCLLQYALTASGSIYEEALHQVKKLPNRVWFSEKGNFHQRRQIMRLLDQVKTVIHIEQDICLIVLLNETMMLVDLSLDCINDPFILTCDYSNDPITKVNLFQNNKYILTLHEKGEMKVRSIEEVLRRSINQRHRSIEMTKPFNIKTMSKDQPNDYKQCFSEIVKYKSGKMVSFYIEELPHDIHLHIALDNGHISLLIWNPQLENFEHPRIPDLQTGMNDICFLGRILNSYYMVLNKLNNITIWDCKDGSKVPLFFNWLEHRTSLIYHEIYNDMSRLQTRIYFVFGDTIQRLILKNSEKVINGELETLYTNADNLIKCAKLSEDEKYLVLGTNNGIIVFDIDTRSEILRGNVSEKISSIDISKLDDTLYKYIIFCGLKHKQILNILALRETENNALDWAHKQSNNQNSINLQLEPTVWLMGQKLYSITHNGLETLLIAVDSRQRILEIPITNDKGWSIFSLSSNSGQITAIASNNENVLSGNQKGRIFNMKTGAIADLPSAITYLEIIFDKYLIASTKTDTNIFEVKDLKEKFHILGCTKQGYFVQDKYLILINLKRGIVIITMEEEQFRIVKYMKEESAYYGSDLQISHLFLSSSSNCVHEYRLNSYDNWSPDRFDIYTDTNEVISCVSASPDASLLAIGFISGIIDVYQTNDVKNVKYRFKSHIKPIYAMLFSPNSDVLVSCSEQLCFWSVSNTNGPKKRRSSRFSSRPTSTNDEVTPTIINRNGNDLEIPDNFFENLKNSNTTNPWHNKRGPPNKPELLACVKFDGNKAEKIYANPEFTEFSTIDDEGVYYHLKLLEFDTFENGNGNIEGNNKIIITTNYHDQDNDNHAGI